MGIKYYIKPEYNLNIFVHTGKIKDDEFIAFYRHLFTSTSFYLSLNQLVDLREADSTPRSPEALQLFADVMQAQLKAMATRPKVAIIAPEDLSFGLARMYEAFASSIQWDLVVFRATEDALAWLGLPEDAMNNHEKAPNRELDVAV